LVEEWLHWMAVVRCCSTGTSKTYRSAMTSMTQFLLAKYLFTDPRLVRTEHLSAWLADLAPRQAPASRLRNLIAARSLFRWLRDSGHVTRNEAALVGRPAVPRRLPAYLTREEVSALLAAAEGASREAVRLLALLHLLYATGMRVAEASALSVAGVDMASSAVRIIAKGNTERAVWIYPLARRALQRWLPPGWLRRSFGSCAQEGASRWMSTCAPLPPRCAAARTCASMAGRRLHPGIR